MTTATLIPPELLTKSDMAKLMQYSEKQIQNLVKAGSIPAPIYIGKHPRWRRSEIMAFLGNVKAS